MSVHLAGQVRAADVLGALSLAADLAIGLPEEHVLRSCYIGMRLAEQMAIPACTSQLAA
jgi:hypothetical protein